MLKSQIFIGIIFILFAQPVRAQSFVQITSNPWYDPVAETGELDCSDQSTPFPVDWDGDGDIDILSGNAEPGLCFFLNDGTDHFSKIEDFGDIDNNGGTSTFVIDWDGDHKYDVFLGRGTGILYFRNTGDESFLGGDEFESQVLFLSATNSTARPAIVDWDADGDLDFVIGEQDDTLEYFENTGDDETFNHYIDWLGIDGGSDTYPEFGDVNEDGHEDLFLGSQDGHIDYYQNNGMGDFEDPILEYQNIFTGGPTNMSSPRFVFWDDDDHLDFIMGNSSGYISLYLNDWDEDGFVGDEDCSDDATINIAATEMCDGVDNDCDGDIDEDNTSDGTTYYADTDEDGFGDADTSIVTCDATAPTGYTTDNTDCNDSDAAAATIITWYYDADADGFGDESISTESCVATTNFVENSTDCDDGDAELSADCPATGDDDDDTTDEATTSSGCSLQSTTQNHSQIILEISLSILALLIARKLKPTTQSQSPNP